MMQNKNRYSKFVSAAILIVSLLGFQNTEAQKTMNLTMDQAIQLSLQSNKQLKVGQARVDEAQAQLNQAKDNMLPDVKMSGSYLRVNNPSVDLKVKLGSGSTTTGTTGGDKNSTPKIDEAAYGIVNATLPLFSGLRIHYGIEAAKYLAEAAKLDAGYQREEVIVNTINAYSNLYKARKAVDLVEENLKQSQQRVTDFNNMEQNGLIARNDLLKTQLEESNIELSLLDAQNNLRITYINMDLMLGLEEGTELIADTNSFASQNDAGTLAGWEQSALQNRKDVGAMALRISAYNSNIKAAKGEYYPGIALTGGYIALDIPNFVTVTNAINGGIGLQYNLGSLWKTGSKIALAKAQLREMQANQGILTDQVRLSINQAYENYMLSQKKIDVYRKSIEQATENYRITHNKYDNSLATTTDLLDADVAALQAKLNYTNANADALVAYKKLQQAAGMLNNK
jgi:outer membrane protein